MVLEGENIKVELNSAGKSNTTLIKQTLKKRKKKDSIQLSREWKTKALTNKPQIIRLVPTQKPSPKLF